MTEFIKIIECNPELMQAIEDSSKDETDLILSKNVNTYKEALSDYIVQGNVRDAALNVAGGVIKDLAGDNIKLKKQLKEEQKTNNILDNKLKEVASPSEYKECKHTIMENKKTNIETDPGDPEVNDLILSKINKHLIKNNIKVKDIKAIRFIKK